MSNRDAQLFEASVVERTRPFDARNQPAQFFGGCLGL